MAYVITTRPSLPRYAVTTTEYCGSCVYRGGGMQMPGADGEMQRKQPYKFGGKEHLNAGGLNIHDFGPRALYAPAGQFSSADPKCEDYPHLSPYLYCAANPVNLTDPTGCRPVYSRTDEFLGVIGDDGLEGEYFIMEEEKYKDGMSLKDANSEYNTLLGMDEKSINRLKFHYNYILPTRPDYDGYITLDEAHKWYRNKSGETLYADFSKLDLSDVSIEEKLPGENAIINLANSVFKHGDDDARVYGNISIKYGPDNTISALPDKFDFDMHNGIDYSTIKRNLFTIIAKIEAGDGVPFKIQFYGTQKIK